MQSRPWPPQQEATEVSLTNANPRIEAALRRMGQQLNNLIQQYNALLAQVNDIPDLATWTGSLNINTIGTIAAGVWEGTPIEDAYIASAERWNAGLGEWTFNTYSVIAINGVVGLDGDEAAPGAVKYYGTDANGAKAWLSLETAMSTWTGANTIATVGTITSGTWHGTAIEDSYIASAATWNAKESALTFSDSLKRSTNTVTLDGDAASPGNSKLYGTNASGVRGWYDQPSGGASFPSGTAYELLTWDNDASDIVSRELVGTAYKVTVTNTADAVTLGLPDVVNLKDVQVSGKLIFVS